MIPRGRIDISYSDLTRGLYYCFRDSLGLSNTFVETLKNNKQLICLSVRTGFDLVLSALDLPPGSEIIVSNINIPDMFAIITAHQLIAVPVGVDKHSLNVSAERIKEAISPKTKVILVTHLFGAVAEMDEITELAAIHNLIVIEDCAQAYAGKDYLGHKDTDVVMQSFGLIKTNTAVSGAMLLFNNLKLAKQVINLNDELPKQSVTVYRKKIIKAFTIRLLTTPWVYTVACFFIKMLGKDIDQVLSGFTRGFPGDDILVKIRFRPNDPLKRLLSYRIEHYRTQNIEDRKKYAIAILSKIPSNLRIGYNNNMHSHWVIPIQTDDPDRLINFLRQKGFDVTAKASSLVSLNLHSSIDSDILKLTNLVYLPAYPGMSSKKIIKLTHHLNSLPG